MAIKVNASFEYGLKGYGDVRQSFATLVDMASYNENLIPNGFMTFCDEDGSNYQFLDMNDVDPITGRWRKFTASADVVDDTLSDSLTKTYSITKIKELLKTTGGFVLVDALPDLTDPDVLDALEINKIYLVPKADTETGNEKDEYVCVHVEAQEAVYRTPAITVEAGYYSYYTIVNNYVTTGGGTTNDDYATFIAATSTNIPEDSYYDIVESVALGENNFATYTARVEATVITPEVVESYAWEYIGSVDGGTLTFADSVIVNNPIGKITNGADLQGRDVISVLIDMLTVDEPTTVKLVGAPSSTTLNEKGVAVITDVALTATIALGTGTVADGADVVFKKDGVAIDTQPFVNGGFTYTFTETGANIVDNTKYSVEVVYTMSGATATAKDEIEYKFALPFFYGVSSTETVADITALTKILSANKTQTVTYTADNAYCLFCCPDTFTVTSIKDSNGFENLDSFNSVTQVATIGTDTVVYNVYTSATKVTCTNFKYVITLA